MSCLRILLTCTFAFSLVLSSPADAKPKQRKVTAVKGKRYALHKAHGPYMIMVTTLRNVKYAVESEGMSAEDAADEIVYQLRKKGIPAYVYQQEEQLNATGNTIVRQAEIAIMAGNFDSPDNRIAEKVLTHIQEKFHPIFLTDEDTGAIIAKKSTTKPFKRAFIIGNPLRSDAEMGAPAVDPAIVALNSDSGDVSLLKNRGRYSVKVATYSGGAIMQVAGHKPKKNGLNLFSDKDDSATKAWELAIALRQASKYGYAQNYEAWVFHNLRESYVTIGSFESPDDPRIRQLIEEFKAKPKRNPKTGRHDLTPELFSIPKNPSGARLPDKLWFFGEDPRPIQVPGR
jgi:hypothetical protein